MARASSIGCVLAGALGCASGEADLFLGFPQLEGARSVVLAVPQNGEIELYAAPLMGSQLRVRIDYDDAGTIEALLFAQSLEELGLAEGALEQPRPGDDAGELGALGPIQSYAARVDGEEAAWIEDPAPAARSARYRKERSVCAAFSAPLMTELTDPLAFATRIDEEHALVGTTDGVLVIVSQSGVTRIDPPFPGYVRSAFLDGAKIYLSEWFSGRIYRGDPSPTAGAVNLERLPDSPLLSGASVMAGGEGTIIAADPSGDAARFDGTSWSMLPRVAVNDSRMRAAWTPDEAFYWARASGALNRVDQSGSVRAESVETGGGAYSIASIAGLGTVLGTGDGSFLQRRDGGWAGLGGEYGWWVLDLDAYAGGFFFLLASGSVGQYVPDPDRPLCMDHLLLGFLFDGRILRLSNSLVIVGSAGNDRPAQVVVVSF